MSIRAWGRVIAEFKAGQSERDFATAVGIELLREGSEFDIAGHVTTATSRSAYDEPLQLGDTIWCDFGADSGGLPSRHRSARGDRCAHR